jgi:hypothetical protein
MEIAGSLEPQLKTGPHENGVRAAGQLQES